METFCNPRVFEDWREWLPHRHSEAELVDRCFWDEMADIKRIQVLIAHEFERDDDLSSDLADEFTWHVAKWREDTEHLSMVSKMILHPSYLRIIGMGRMVLPLILQELKRSPDHWFYALTAVSGENPARAEDTFDAAVKAWLDWGRQRGYIS